MVESGQKLLPTDVAQIVRPYDPSTAPPAAVETSQNLLGPIIGLSVATLVVLVIVVYTLKKKRQQRR